MWGYFWDLLIIILAVFFLKLPHNKNIYSF